MFLTLFLIVFVIYVLYMRYANPAVADVPVHPGCVPVFGHLLKMATIKEFFNFLILDTAKFCNENGGVTVLKSPFMPLYFITNLKDAQTILDQCMDKMFVYKLVTHIDRNLFVADFPVWKRNRNILNKCFKQNVVDGYMSLFNDQAKMMIEAMSKHAGKAYADVKDILHLNSVQTASAVSFGSNEGVDELMIHMTEKLFKILTSRFSTLWKVPEFVFNYTQLKKEQDEAIDVINSRAKYLIELGRAEYMKRKKRTELNNNEAPKFQSTLDIILDNTLTDDGCMYGDEELLQILVFMVGAQSDTTHRQMFNLLLCIGTYPDIQEKVYQEVMEIVGDSEVTKEHLSRLVYCEAVIKECIRYLPIAPLLGRQSDKEVQLSKVTIPPGGTFAIHAWAINRNKEYWGADAEEFRPERWLNPDTLPENPAAFMSFSLGKKNCMGKPIAMMTLKTNLVYVSRRYHITADLNKVKFSYFAMIQPKGRKLMRIENR